MEDRRAEARRKTRAELAECTAEAEAITGRLREEMGQAEIEQMGANPYADAKSRRELLETERAHDREMNVTPGMVKAFQMATRSIAGHREPSEDAIFTGLTVALFKRILETAKTPELHPVNLDPYPGTVGELAQEFIRVVVDLEESGAARGVAWRIQDGISGYLANQDDGRAEQESNRHEGGPF